MRQRREQKGNASTPGSTRASQIGQRGDPLASAWSGSGWLSCVRRDMS